MNIHLIACVPTHKTQKWWSQLNLAQSSIPTHMKNHAYINLYIGINRYIISTHKLRDTEIFPKHEYTIPWNYSILTCQPHQPNTRNVTHSPKKNILNTPRSSFPVKKHRIQALLYKSTNQFAYQRCKNIPSILYKIYISSQAHPKLSWASTKHFICTQKLRNNCIMCPKHI